MDDVLRGIWSAIRVFWAFVWNWWFLCIANVGFSLWSLLAAVFHPTLVPVVRCDLDNLTTMYVDGWVKQQDAGMQAATSFLALVENIPDFSAPGLFILLAGMWIIRGIIDNSDGGLDTKDIVAGVCIFVFSVGALAVDFTVKVGAAEKQANGGLTLMSDWTIAINEVAPFARRVANEEPHTSQALSVRACSIAVQMISAQNLKMCSRNDILACFETAQKSAESMKAIDAATRRWIFEEKKTISASQ